MGKLFLHSQKLLDYLIIVNICHLALERANNAHYQSINFHKPKHIFFDVWQLQKRVLSLPHALDQKLAQLHAILDRVQPRGVVATT